MNNILFFCLFLIWLPVVSVRGANVVKEIESTLVFSKTDFPGCPENALCSEATGKTREFFKRQLKEFLQNKISEAELNHRLTKNAAYPFPIFAKNNNHHHTGLALWESQCRQHKFGIRYYQGEIFLSEVNKTELHKLDFVLHPLIIKSGNEISLLYGLMGEAPVAIKKIQNLWRATYLREDDGAFYLFSVNEKGKLYISKVQEKLTPAQSGSCPPEMSAQFLRFSESPSFYSVTSCRQIENKPENTLMLYGIPCL